MGPFSALCQVTSLGGKLKSPNSKCNSSNRPFQHGWVMSRSKSSLSAWLERVTDKNVSFSMDRISRRKQNPKSELYGEEEELEKEWYSLDLVPTTSYLVKIAVAKAKVFPHLEAWVQRT
jgi:hypothetical protein